MRIEDLKWWQWVVFSLLLGWLLAYVNSSPVPTVGMLEQQATQFERDVLTPPVGEQKIPWVRKVVVYPLLQGSSTVRAAQVVVYEALAPRPNGGPNEFQYRRNWFCAPVPYVPSDPRFARETRPANGLYPGFEKTYQVKPQDTLETITAAVYGQDTAAGENAIAIANQEFRRSHSVKALMDSKRVGKDQEIYIPWNPNGTKTVLDWLQDAEKDYPWVHHSFAWWKVPEYCSMVWIGSTFAVIGVVWPMTLSLLTTAGLGRPPVKDKYDISRFGSGVSKNKAPAPKPRAEMTEAELKQLSALNDALTASIKEGLPTGASPAPAAHAPAGQQIPGRIFTSAPAQAPVPIIEQPKEDKEFAGEFYPVARPAGHTEVEPPPADSDKIAGKPAPPKGP
jgi:hypothetical protein